jgi:NDP-sugar pyrophosphorylase family protein
MAMREMHIAVLAGGFGTRLRSIVPDLPKPLAPVEGLPFLKYQIDAWESEGASTITFLLHYEADKIEAYLDARKRSNPKCQVNYEVLIEPQPLGTGGAIANAVRYSKYLKNNFYVVNADTWLKGGLTAMTASTAPAIGLVYVGDSRRYGRVSSEGGRVISFLEKDASSMGGWINAGMYHLEPRLFEDWDGAPCSLELDLLPRLIQKQHVCGLELKSEFIDIGIPEDYQKFCTYIARG